MTMASNKTTSTHCRDRQGGRDEPTNARDCCAPRKENMLRSHTLPLPAADPALIKVASLPTA